MAERMRVSRGLECVGGLVGWNSRAGALTGRWGFSKIWTHAKTRGGCMGLSQATAGLTAYEGHRWCIGMLLTWLVL